MRDLLVKILITMTKKLL